jgi:hypothetical protein
MLVVEGCDQETVDVHKLPAGTSFAMQGGVAHQCCLQASHSLNLRTWEVTAQHHTRLGKPYSQQDRVTAISFKDPVHVLQKYDWRTKNCTAPLRSPRTGLHKHTNSNRQ